MQPEELTPREAWERYIDRRRPESTDHSMKTYYYRLKQFVEWCEKEGITCVGDLNGWTFENYETYRAGEDLAPVTLNGEMKDLRLFIEYLERIEAVEDGLSDRIHIPKVSDDEASSDKKLATEDAKPLLEYYRRYDPGSRSHALLEVLWNTGARLGAIRALDVRDFHPDDQYLEFVHRAESGTPLKKKVNGERPVALSAAAVDALNGYLKSSDRWDKRDDHGREPLFTSRLGRPGQNTVRCWTYMATLPCLHSECPHGRKRETCDFTERNSASKCPSSRSPHQIRTGSITYQLDSGLPPEVVATRVNASVETIKKHYDKATPRQRMQQRRRRYVDRLEFDS